MYLSCKCALFAKEKHRFSEINSYFIKMDTKNPVIRVINLHTKSYLPGSDH